MIRNDLYYIFSAARNLSVEPLREETRFMRICKINDTDTLVFNSTEEY